MLCQGQYVLPVGMSDSLRKSRVKVFCPLCEEVYSPKSKCKDIDGGYFGTSFPHVFLQNRPEASPRLKKICYAPRISGYQVYKKNGSKYKDKQEEVKYESYYVQKEQRPIKLEALTKE